MGLLYPYVCDQFFLKMKAVKSDLKTALTTRDWKAASMFLSTFHINSGLSGEACGAAAPATGRQYRGCIIPQAVTHSLVLLKMGKIIARNMLS